MADNATNTSKAAPIATLCCTPVIDPATSRRLARAGIRESVKTVRVTLAKTPAVK